MKSEVRTEFDCPSCGGLTVVKIADLGGCLRIADGAPVVCKATRVVVGHLDKSGVPWKLVELDIDCDA